MSGRSVVPAIKAKTKAKRPPAAPEREDHRAFVAAIGRLLRLARAKRGMTRRQLAQASGVSERYLAQIEGGAGNPSVIMLASIAQALDVPIIELLPRSNGRTAAMAQILDVLARTPRAELPALGCPFIELDRLVEQDYGARIPDLIEMAGLATFRRYERACLERVIDEHE